MRRCATSVFAVAVGSTAMRFQSARYDLFGYEVDTNTKPWIDKIKACKNYDQAGEVLVDMNVKNCPPDLATYNATLQNIYECKSKTGQPATSDMESKFCAMMDLLEEMHHRNKVKPDAESWTWIMKECIAGGNFRVGYVVADVMTAEFGGCPSDLVAANEANAQKAIAAGKEHPGHLSKQEAMFDINIK
jgi:hypothetical protein